MSVVRECHPDPTCSCFHSFLVVLAMLNGVCSKNHGCAFVVPEDRGYRLSRLQTAYRGRRNGKIAQLNRGDTGPLSPLDEAFPACQPEKVTAASAATAASRPLDRSVPCTGCQLFFVRLNDHRLQSRAYLFLATGAQGKASSLCIPSPCLPCRSHRYRRRRVGATALPSSEKARPLSSVG